MNMIVGDDRKGLFIRTKKRMLNQADILYIESMAKKVEIHTAGEPQSIEVYATMRDLEEQLGENFYRCHRTYIVNMAYITKYAKDCITLTNGDKIYVAKKRYRGFVETYRCYLRDGKVSSV